MVIFSGGGGGGGGFFSEQELDSLKQDLKFSSKAAYDVGQEGIFVINGNPFYLLVFILNWPFYQLVLKLYNDMLPFSVYLLSQYNPFIIILVALRQFVYYWAFRLNILIKLF